MRISAACAVLLGLALRIFFVLRFPMADSGDAPLYSSLAWNWLKHGIYGIPVFGALVPVDMRVPGYPAFLAAIFALFGRSHFAVLMAQAVVDLASCVLIALIAARLAPENVRRNVMLAALWLAALCPFTANYAAVMQTEALAIFLTALAILLLLQTELGPAPHRPTAWIWFAAGIVTGLGALVRPETPLLLLAAGLLLAWRFRRPADWTKLLRATALMAAGLALALAPWAARNRRTLHETQFLAPRYGQLPGETVPRGFNSWTSTWLWRMRDVYLIPWKLDTEQLSITDVPASAFDTPPQRARIAAIFAQYNSTLTLSPAMDASFARIARERTRRRPFRTYLKIPFLRALTLWFSPRVELLPISGHLHPFRQLWDADPVDVLVTLAAIAIAVFYSTLALAGAWIARLRPACAFLVLFILIRTAFFAAFVETPEPRYVLECFPALLALAAQAWSLTPRLRAPREYSAGKSAGIASSPRLPATP
ncbi:MAG TPA: glycosyltransferase family 39 protein [Candidatus Acidoferrales bacterium]|nr:glycosyltransferase family 39 protein [Candidatus Acidoferrales bacterium]